MMSIATAACAFCVTQSANAAETSTVSGVNTTVNSSANNSSDTGSNTAGSSSVTSSNVSSSNAGSNTTNGGGSSFAKGSAKEVKTSEPKNIAESAKPSEQGKAADSATTVQSTAIYAAATGAASSQSQTGNQQTTQITSSTNNGSTANDDSSTWTRDDFNISADGKMIGGRKDVYYPDKKQTVNEYVDGLTDKGKEKLKKNHHIVIPEGIEVIHECAFTGHAKQVGDKKHEHIDGETYIEGVTLPQSLKIIEYGAFGWNKIKGTVVIPKSVISIHSAAFVANEIEKVVFEGVLDGNGKEHDADTTPYYLAGVGEKAFQGNKISEIVVKDNLGKYKLYPSNNPQKSDSVFDNQNPGTFTIEVGDEYKHPITITQENSNHTISVMEGFAENGTPTLIDQSSYFKKNADGKYIAVKTGTIDGQCMFYDTINGNFRIIGISHFTYNIIPKVAIYTVTFVDGDNANYASVQVKAGKSISDNSVAGQSMPAAQSKAGYTFREWNADSTGKNKNQIFTDSTQVNSNMTVYAIYDLNAVVLNQAPILKLQDKTITEGESLDLNSLIVSATDSEDGDLTSKVKLADNGGFDNTKVGSYNVTFSVKDKGGATATAAATVTVTKKPTPPTPPEPAPTPEPEPEPEPMPTPEPDIDWDDIPDIDLTPDQEPEPTPVPDFPVPVAPAPILPPAAEAEPEPAPAPAPSQPEQPEQQAKHAVKHLPKTGSTTTPILASAIASLLAGLAGLAESFAADRKRRN